jgi:hypothetical protein
MMHYDCFMFHDTLERRQNTQISVARSTGINDIIRPFLAVGSRGFCL